MKNVKAWIALCCVLALLLAGCQGNAPANTNPPDSNTQTEAPVQTEAPASTPAPTPEPTPEPTDPPAPAAELAYDFSGSDAATPGYAEGTITLNAEDGSYQLYWADDAGALEGYYEIADLEVSGGSAAYSFGYHAAIPAGATKVIAAAGEAEYPTVDEAVAVWDIPAEKQLGHQPGEELYTFNSFSDIHIDEEKVGETTPFYWVFSEAHWANALDYAVSKGVDFIVSSGDQVTNARLENLDKEWKAYQYILAQSDYCNPIYESGGNHEVRQDGAVSEELQAFVTGSGLDSSLDTLTAAKPYYYITEPKTGDVFIFMALEGGYRPAQYDEFTDEQLDWVEGLLDQYYGQGKNVYLIQHGLISGYGPGDDLDTPYYGGAVNPELASAQRFISILEAHPDMIWISGHSHEDFTLGYNFTNNDGASCYMIHNPSVGNPTHVTDGSLDYTFYEDNSQGYYVQVFEDAIVFSGANLVCGKIFPAYSYIIPGSTSLQAQETPDEPIYTDVTADAPTLRSVIANAKSMLGIYYEFSSYDQYQTLKRWYYEYKDADTDAMSAEELQLAYSRLRLSIAYLHQAAEFTAGRNFAVSVPEPEPEVAKREKDLLVRIHYHREDGDYEPWSVWLWGTGDGTDNPFTGTDDFGVYLEYTAAPDVTSLGFIVRTESWGKDIEDDQFINVDGSITGDTLDVYIESGVPGYEVR